MARVGLTGEQRTMLSAVIGVGHRWALHHGARPERGAAVAAIHAITRDAVVLGVALGVVMAATELDGWRSFQRLADLFQAAGADQQVAEAEFAWHRDRRSRFRARR